MNVQQRLARLEQQNRRLWVAVWGITAVGGVCLFGAAYQGELPEVIQASRFEVVNEEGKVVWRASSAKAGGYSEALRANGRTKCSWNGASPGDGGGMTMIWGGDDNEFRWVASTWKDGAFTGCIHGVDGKPDHQDGFTTRLESRRGIRVGLQHDGEEIWSMGVNKGLRPAAAPQQVEP